MLAICVCAMLGGSVIPDSDLPPSWLRLAPPAHALIGEDLLPRHEPIERRPPDEEAIRHWYEEEISKAQADNERNLRKIDMRFQEQWPGADEERQGAYDRARQREMERYERKVRDLQRQYQQKFRR